MASSPLWSKAKREELGFAYWDSATENRSGEKEKNPAQKEKENLKPSFKGKQSGILLLVKSMVGQSQDRASLAYAKQ